MIRLVLVDMDRALGTRDGKPLGADELAQLKGLLQAGLRVAPMSQRGLREAAILLGGERDLLRDAVLRSGSEVYCDGELLTGTRAASRLAGARALMEILNLAPDEVVVLGATDADAELMSELPYGVATRDAATYTRAAARAVVAAVSDGGLVAFCQDMAKAAEWGEEPALLRESEEAQDSGLRAEFGDGGDSQPGRQRPRLSMLLGVIVVVAGIVAYLSNAFSSFAGMIFLTVGLLVGVALFYLGLSQRRDERRRRRAERREASAAQGPSPSGGKADAMRSDGSRKAGGRHRRKGQK